eukprot:7341000-Pyramimonas_sp.AAC.1
MADAQLEVLVSMGVTQVDLPVLDNDNDDITVTLEQVTNSKSGERNIPGAEANRGSVGHLLQGHRHAGVYSRRALTVIPPVTALRETTRGLDDTGTNKGRVKRGKKARACEGDAAAGPEVPLPGADINRAWR